MIMRNQENGEECSKLLIQIFALSCFLLCEEYQSSMQLSENLKKRGFIKSTEIGLLLNCKVFSQDGSYQDFPDRELLLTRKLLNQGFLLVKLRSSLREFYSRPKKTNRDRSDF
jgi:hypothetical protein